MANLLSSTLNASQCLLKLHLGCLEIYIYFVLNFTKVKKIGNVTVKNYLNESLLSLLCFIIYSQGSFEKALMILILSEIYLIAYAL